VTLLPAAACPGGDPPEGRWGLQGLAGLPSLDLARRSSCHLVYCKNCFLIFSECLRVAATDLRHFLLFRPLKLGSSSSVGFHVHERQAGRRSCRGMSRNLWSAPHPPLLIGGMSGKPMVSPVLCQMQSNLNIANVSTPWLGSSPGRGICRKPKFFPHYRTVIFWFPCLFPCGCDACACQRHAITASPFSINCKAQKMTRPYFLGCMACTNGMDDPPSPPPPRPSPPELLPSNSYFYNPLLVLIVAYRLGGGGVLKSISPGVCNRGVPLGSWQLPRGCLPLVCRPLHGRLQLAELATPGSGGSHPPGAGHGFLGPLQHGALGTLPLSPEHLYVSVAWPPLRFDNHLHHVNGVMAHMEPALAETWSNPLPCLCGWTLPKASQCLHALIAPASGMKLDFVAMLGA